MNTFLFNSQSEVNGSSPQLESQPKLSYFDVISNRLDAWQAQQQAIREAKAQVTKSFLLQDVDEVTGETKVYRLSLELLRTVATPLEQTQIFFDGEELETYVS